MISQYANKIVTPYDLVIASIKIVRQSIYKLIVMAAAPEEKVVEKSVPGERRKKQNKKV